MAGLTRRQEGFCREYAKGCPAAEAAGRAGYKPARARRTGETLLGLPAVQRRIRQLQQDVSWLQQGRVLEEVARIAFACYTDFAQIAEEADEDGRARQVVRLRNTGEIPQEQCAAVASIKQTAAGIEIKLYDKWRALQLLLKYCALGQEGEGQGEGVRIVDDV